MTEPSVPLSQFETSPIILRVNIASVLQRSESCDSAIRRLCYFRRSCDQSSTPAPAPPPPPLQSSVGRHRETLLPEKQRSVRRVVTLSTHRINRERERRGGEKKRAANKHPLFSLKQDSVCCCAPGSDVSVMVHPPCDLWAHDSLKASVGGAH